LSPGRIGFPVEGVSDGVIRLRLKAESDIPAIVAACQDPEIPRWTQVPDDYTEAEAREWFELQDRRRADGSELHLIIADAEGSRLLGSIGLTAIDWDDRRGSIGYWVAPESRGEGIATRAVTLLAQWSFDELGLGRVEIKAEPANVASHRVAERAGFTREGLLRSHALIKDRRRDMVVFSLLPGELKGDSPGSSLKA
jgi:RimJ/RimL family protein N-acetyltransferase